MALIDNSPCVLCVFQYFSLSAERENHQSYSCQSFSSLEKKRCTRLFGNSYPCLLMLISFRLVLHSLSARQGRAKRHSRIQMEMQFNAKKKKKTSRQFNDMRMFVHCRLHSVTAKTFPLHSGKWLFDQM